MRTDIAHPCRRCDPKGPLTVELMIEASEGNSLHRLIPHSSLTGERISAIQSVVFSRDSKGRRSLRSPKSHGLNDGHVMSFPSLSECVAVDEYQWMNGSGCQQCVFLSGLVLPPL